MDKEQYKLLSEHLDQIDPALLQFCEETGYTMDNSNLGRYPRRRLQKCGEVSCFFDLQMDLDQNGERYEVFSDALPYSMGAGVGFDEGDFRYSKRFLVMDGLSFLRVSKELIDILLETDQSLQKWNKERVRSEGRKVKLSR
ncbi:MAG: hypothetical protein L3J39_16645 [Verrucomicrobiales bacterium]|nr:hypothetical protein [Verrucomicrobiales bacterium]